MTHWLWWVWLQLWPNLAANVLWVPIALWWHHSRIRRQIDRALAAELAHYQRGATDAAPRQGQPAAP